MASQRSYAASRQRSAAISGASSRGGCELLPRLQRCRAAKVITSAASDAGVDRRAMS